MVRRMSNYSFGWWDFHEDLTSGPRPWADGPSARQGMVNRYSDERVVMGGALDAEDKAAAIAAHPEHANESWLRFDYEHEEFCFPLVVAWNPEAGRILVDYNLSAALWRRETNTKVDWPPYGGWCRVDDMVADAFWCWPGVLEVLMRHSWWADLEVDPYRSTYMQNLEDLGMGTSKNLFGIVLVGGWSNAQWRQELLAREVVILNTDDAETDTARWKQKEEDVPHLGPRLDASSMHRLIFDVPKFYDKYRHGRQFQRIISNFFDETANIIDIDSATPLSPWVFHLDDYANLKSLVVDERKLNGEIFYREGKVACVISQDGRRTFLPLQEDFVTKGGVSSYDFVYYSVLSTEHIIKVYGGDIRHFSAVHDYDTILQKFLSEGCVHQIKLAPRDITPEVMAVIRRDLTDAFLMWSGIPVKSEPNENSRHLDEILPLKLINSAIGYLAGRQCYGRSRLTKII